MVQKLNQDERESPFEGKVRVRVCGILTEEERVLLLKHNHVGPAGHLWSPPGGGVAFGESHEDALKKEFREEVNLEIEVVKYLFANEYIDKRHHAIELFFEVKRISGDLLLGFDPELEENNQMLAEVHFFSKEELEKLPANTIHNAFNAADERDKITELRGLITFKY